jgi:hypothetical protein
MHQYWPIALLVTAFGLAWQVRADEGMWTFDNFPSAKMQAAYGWAPDQAWLTHVRLSSIRLAQGCSASLVSADGLVMTNDHCARACLSGLADSQHDYVANGFYAVGANDEKRCPALEANQLTDISDVTAQVDAATAGKSDRAFHEAERAIRAQIESQCGTGDDVRCQVVALYHGAVYDLYKFKRYQDIRIVFAPEASMAFFGGDPDNFNFPRFDLDCAFVRIYDHGAPLHTENYLKFARQGVKAGDITLTSGNPGGTEREDTVATLQFYRDAAQPFMLTFYSEFRGLLIDYANKGPEEARTADTLLFRIENSLKAYKGRQLALVQGPLMQQKARDEADFRQRVANDPKLAATTASAWDAIASVVAHEQNVYVRYMLLEAYPRSLSPLLGQATTLNRYATESTKPNGERLEEYSDANFAALRQQILSPAPIYPKLEQTVLGWWLAKVREDLGTTDADFIAVMGKRSPGEIAAAIVSGTKLSDAAFRKQLLEGGASAINAYHDPLMDFVRTLDAPARAVRTDYENNVAAPLTASEALIGKARFALDGRGSYPDATFTLRLSYGTVAGYQENGHAVMPVTDFAGAYAHATGSDPFALPQKWITARTLINPHANLNFSSSNDIIGGNSGSPVIGRNGDVVGLIFDGNIQSLGGDYGYDGSVNRSVAVDVTGITEALKHIYQADRLVKELVP